MSCWSLLFKLLWICWTFWMCRFMYFANIQAWFHQILFDIKYHFFLSLVFWNSWYVYVIHIGIYKISVCLKILQVFEVVLVYPSWFFFFPFLRLDNLNWPIKFSVFSSACSNFPLSLSSIIFTSVIVIFNLSIFCFLFIIYFCLLMFSVWWNFILMISLILVYGLLQHFENVYKSFIKSVSFLTYCYY